MSIALLGVKCTVQNLDTSAGGISASHHQRQLPEMTDLPPLFSLSFPLTRERDSFIRLLFSFPNISILSPFLLLQIEDMRLEVQRKEQDLMQLQAKMKTVEEQHADYQKHIAVLKESLIAKEEHYNMLQMDVSTSSLLLSKNEVRKIF